MPFHMLLNDPFDPLHFSLNLFEVVLVCCDAPPQTVCPVAQDVVYVFTRTFVRVCHSRLNFGRIFTSEKLIRCIATNVAAEVEEARGSTTATACNAKTELVEAKLEVVRPAGLFHCGSAVSRVCWINTRDRLQRDEIHRCLPGGIGPRQGGSRCD
jgi:hypothetical protein